MKHSIQPVVLSVVSFIFSRKNILVGAALSVVFSAVPSAIFGQTKKIGSISAKNIFQIKDYNPIFRSRRFIKIRELTLGRRFAPDGPPGEFLDIVFLVENLTVNPIEIYAFTAAYYETSAANETDYKWIQGVQTAKFIEQEGFMVQRISTVPQDIPPSKIWDERDPDYLFYQRIVDFKRNLVSTTEPIRDVYPPFWKYLSYMASNPSEGLRFTLHGLSSPKAKDRIQTGQGPAILMGHNGQTFITKKLRPKYVLEHGAQKTIFRTYHFAKFHGNQKLFNRIAIQLFDAKKADQAAPRGKKTNIPLVKKLYSINIRPYES